jgi:tetratricopeptide (TPR) repeat protein
MGTLWLQQGKTSEAKKHFVQAIKLDPDYSESFYQLALLAKEAGKSTEAIRYLQRLTLLTPHRAEVFLLLGELYLQQGQYVSAALHAWEARDIQPDSPDVEQLLLHVYSKLFHHQQEVVKHQQPLPSVSGASLASDGKP